MHRPAVRAGQRRHLDRRGTSWPTRYRSPITLGMIAGYVVGKPVAIVGSSWLLTRLSRGRLRPTVGWAAVIGSGTIAGIGFTVSFLIATSRSTGTELAQAKLGVLVAAVLATGLTWVVFRLTATLPEQRRRAGPARRRGAAARPGRPGRPGARPHPRAGGRDRDRGRVRRLPVPVLRAGGARRSWPSGEIDPDLRYVWRHLPLTDVHPQAQLAAEAAEAAAAQGAFWPMHDLLLPTRTTSPARPAAATPAELGLDERRFREDLKRHVHAGRVAQDVETADTERGRPARRRSSSTASATPAGSASRGWPRRCGRPGPGPSSAPVPRTRPTCGSAPAAAGSSEPAQRTGRRASCRLAQRYEPSAMATHQATATIPSVPIGCRQQPAQGLDDRGERLVLGEPAQRRPASSRSGRTRCPGTAAAAGTSGCCWPSPRSC